MTQRQATALATKIVKEARPRVRIVRGRTNGHSVLHIVNLDAQDRRYASKTIHQPHEWEDHEWNRYNQKTETQDESLEAVA